MGLSKAKIKKYSLLRHKKYRDKEGLFLVQGKKNIDDTSDYFELEDIITDKLDIEKITTLENAPDKIAVYKIPSKKFSLKAERDNFYLVLDGIQDPGNLGTIVRTAHWFGITKIFCSRESVDIYNPKTVSGTMGSLAKVDVIYCDLKDLFGENPEIPVYGLGLKGENLYEIKDLPPGFIVMGNEGHGLREETLAKIKRILTIPPKNKDNRPESLNVAIATAITLSQILK